MSWLCQYRLNPQATASPGDRKTTCPDKCLRRVFSAQRLLIKYDILCLVFIQNIERMRFITAMSLISVSHTGEGDRSTPDLIKWRTHKTQTVSLWTWSICRIAIDALGYFKRGGRLTGMWTKESDPELLKNTNGKTETDRLTGIQCGQIHTYDEVISYGSHVGIENVKRQAESGHWKHPATYRAPTGIPNEREMAKHIQWQTSTERLCMCVCTL